MNQPYRGDGPARKFRDTIMFTPVKRGDGAPGAEGEPTGAQRRSGLLVIVAVAVVVVVLVLLLSLVL